VTLTVEALLVAGAEKRDELLPEAKDKDKPVQAQTLADPARTYTDILTKNMFTGIPADSKLTEFPADVLGAVRLTAIWSDNGRSRWQATFYDQGKGGDEKKLRPPVIDEFSVSDKYDNVLVRAKVLKLDESGMIFQADNKVYRWRTGEFLGPVMETPLKDSELKDLGVKVAAEAGSVEKSSADK
jgi:hypothetical protein